MTRRALIVPVFVALALLAPAFARASQEVDDMAFCRLWLERLEQDLDALWKLLHPASPPVASLNGADELTDGVLRFQKNWRQSHWRLAESHRRSFEVYMFAVGKLLKGYRKSFEDEAARKSFDVCYELIDDLRGNIKSDWFKPEDEHRATAFARLRNKMIPDLRSNAKAACAALTKAIQAKSGAALEMVPAAGLPGEDLPGESLDDGYDTLPGSGE